MSQIIRILLKCKDNKLRKLVKMSIDEENWQIFPYSLIKDHPPKINHHPRSGVTTYKTYNCKDKDYKNIRYYRQLPVSKTKGIRQVAQIVWENPKENIFLVYKSKNIEKKIIINKVTFLPSECKRLIVNISLMEARYNKVFLNRFRNSIKLADDPMIIIDSIKPWILIRPQFQI